MQLFCPACQSAHSGASRCPKCGGLLLMPQEVNTHAPRHGDHHAEPVPPGTFGRIALGVLVALGLYLGLRKIATGWLLAFDIEPESWWLSFEGLQIIFGLQTTALMFGAVLAAAGRSRGLSLGAFVGGACGVLFLTAELGNGVPTLDLVLLVQPVVLMVAGAIAGVVGARVWPAAPIVDMPLPSTPNKLSSITLVKDRPESSGRPTAWLRILVGAALVVLSMVFAERVRFGAQKYSDGAFQVSSQGQGKFLSWQLGTLAALIGGALAGAGTGAGVRHGIIAGMLAGIALVALSAANGGVPVPVEYWLGRLELKGLGATHPGTIGGVIGGAVLIGVVGGWLGGTLFLPLAPMHMRNKRLSFGSD